MAWSGRREEGSKEDRGVREREERFLDDDDDSLDRIRVLGEGGLGLREAAETREREAVWRRGKEERGGERRKRRGRRREKEERDGIES